MIPDLASIMRKRYWIETAIRLAALILFVLWFVRINLLSYLIDLLTAVGSAATSFRISHLMGYMLQGSGYLVAGVLLAVFSRRLARWIAPLPHAGCPRCGYRLIALREPRCPECGTVLPREFLGGSDA